MPAIVTLGLSTIAPASALIVAEGPTAADGGKAPRR